MNINVRFFALARDLAQIGAMNLSIPDGATVGKAVSQIVERYSSLSKIEPRLATAVNQEYVSRETVLNDGDELALIPPVSGG
jgi:molybdopterin converting factor subunit 1